jgi:hypothetical protein
MFPIVFFFIALVIGLGAGAGVLIGQAWGARQTHLVKAIAGSTLLLGLLIGLVAAVVGSVFARSSLVGLGTPGDVLDDAVAYAHVMLWFMPTLLVFVLFTQLLRGVSDTLSPLLALVVSTCIGLALTPALIRGWLGLPPMGIQSAAFAGLAGNLAAMGWLAWRLIRNGHPLAPDREFSDRLADGGVVALGAGDSGAGQPARFPGDGGLWRGDPDRQLRAVPGAVDCDHGIDPRCAGDRGRAYRAHWLDLAYRADDQPVPDRWPGGVGLRAVALVAGLVPHRRGDAKHG